MSEHAGEVFRPRDAAYYLYTGESLEVLVYSTAASEMQTSLSKGAWVKEGIGDFLKGRYRPGLESHKD